jgi:hypothetical protein
LGIADKPPAAGWPFALDNNVAVVAGEFAELGPELALDEPEPELVNCPLSPEHRG